MDSAILKSDTISGNLEIIEAEHATIHDGTHFTVSVLATTSSYLTLAYTTPASTTRKRIHLVYAANADKAGVVTFYEAGSVSAGSSITAINNDRESATTDPGTWKKDPTITTWGSALETHSLGTSQNTPARPGGGANARNEWYLKYNTTYILRFAADTATTRTEITVPFYYRQEPTV